VSDNKGVAGAVYMANMARTGLVGTLAVVPTLDRLAFGLEKGAVTRPEGRAPSSDGVPRVRPLVLLVLKLYSGLVSYFNSLCYFTLESITLY